MVDQNDDPGLRRALERLAPPPPDVDAAYTRVQKGVRKARHRRGLVWIVSGASVLTLMAAAATALPGDDTSDQVIPAESTALRQTEENNSTTTHAPDSTQDGEDQGDEPTSTVGRGDGDGQVDEPTTTPHEGDGTTTTEHHGDGTTSTTEHHDDGTTTTTQHHGDGTTTTTTTEHHEDTTTTTEHHEDTTTTQVPEPIFETCSSPGGSIRVRLQGDSFTLVSTSHPDGWDLDEWAKGGNWEIHATFVNDHGGQWRVLANVTDAGGILCRAFDQSQPDGGGEDSTTTTEHLSDGTTTTTNTTEHHADG